ncbi:GDP-fucose transporter 1 isoform X2 [Schistocerca cancellata]|uniref:GDP-fucose transporter 1 isoform X2 n=1 Tax=Schistocerca cancellata TaxID=274614 RepID=UPI002119020E|nr:GDP-fucose transporter 1 isoform X2 [Schistocerca cancellata]
MGDNVLCAQYLKIFFVVCAYWIVSILTVFVNKSLLSGETVNLNAPLFVTWYQCVVSSFVCFSLSTLSKWFPSIVSFPNGSPFQNEVFLKVLPLSILFTGMIAFNNLCLKYVDVSFYYIGRSLTTVFNVLLSYIILGSFSLLGTLFGVLGSLFLSLYSIYTKKVLPAVNQEIWLLSYFNNVYSCIIFLPFIALTGEISNILAYDKLLSPLFWFLMTIGGFFGLAIGFVTALQIKVTSPLTHNISGTAKACAQTVIASYWYDENRPFLWWISNWIVLVASASYARIKQHEMEQEHKAQKTERL